ncbi:cadherin repeat domain-containing protein [Poritiphilus flavus]|uniref:Cadherin domain-containing protein n=1 Tax=Poritiphilus flavus TaxID=2697053 RepID=A0A6L9EET2_9FLAO|nr:cadherin repeat domain-containing protein [Poritiphilus flavus]NAS13163.1 hypothetical protein [Poritiphilus flavus]
MKKIAYILIVGLTLFGSCSKEGNSPTPSTVEANDFSISIDEHPFDGTSLGRVEGNNLENAVFKIVSQNPANAMSINGQTGEITVQDSTLFDYEINPILTASMTVNNDVSSDDFKLEITLNDIDEIEFYLTDSKETYRNAENGEWISITENEYETLATALIQVTRIGTNQEEYNAEGETITSSTDFTFALDGAKIPEGGLVFAFKYDNASPLSERAKLKFTEDIWRGYEDFGPLFPSHGEGENFFLLKGNNTAFEKEGYLGFYNENRIRWIRTEGLDTRFFFVFGDSSTMSQSYQNFIVRYQGLSTMIKQWK